MALTWSLVSEALATGNIVEPVRLHIRSDRRSDEDRGPDSLGISCRSFC